MLEERPHSSDATTIIITGLEEKEMSATMATCEDTTARSGRYCKLHLFVFAQTEVTLRK